MEIDVGNMVSFCIIHGLPRTTLRVLNAEHHQIGAVNHSPVSCLVGTSEMTGRDGVIDFDIIIILTKIYFVVPEFRSWVGQNPD